MSVRIIDAAANSSRRLLVGAILVGIAVVYALYEGSVTYPPGVLVSEDPSQSPAESVAPWEYKGLTIKPLASFRLRARVLRSERYWFDGGAKVAPVDLALGWGPMSDQRVIDRLSIWQGQRWFRWMPKDNQPPIPMTEIANHSSNMHMIPSTDQIKDQLLALRNGQLVGLGGYLVRVSGKDGWSWTSSLSRTDSGSGSCELVWVEYVDPR
ncbi:MAG TPA: hypothetical protein VLE22_08325 [Bryobacteraceae bacterium]|nr:hypothetical protein [Bryobacteraceae bacterium]